jgi:hypothetical protein
MGPDAADIGLDLGQHGHGGIVAVQPLGGKDMRLDQPMERLERGGARADLVGKRRQAEIDTFMGIAVALPVERLVLPELLEQDHRQHARPEQPSRRDVERCR